ncbi:MAG TPA: CpaD family pilus assembly protein [Croceibacterium sp.]|nr:CpaD family pilus assembly protein [Croceibacterium sp.]
MPLHRTTAAALALTLGLAACNQPPVNTSLNSTKQPVVERSNFTLDLAAGAGGLSVPEQQRLDDWFESLGLKYGDRISLDGGVGNEAVHEDVAAIAGRHGLLLAEGAPVTSGFVQPGSVRVVVTRTTASVPGCPDWQDHFASNLENALSDGFGCAVNSNFAAMVADPEHLLHGAEGTGETVVMSSTKAIEAYRERDLSGSSGTVSAVSSQSTGGN